MNIVVLGGMSKFGLEVSQHFEREGHTVLKVGRPDVDFKSGWLGRLNDMVHETFGGPSEVDAFIINVFDHDIDAEGVQLNVFQTLWPLLRDTSVTIVVVGSMGHYVGPPNSDYHAAKKLLATKVIMAAYENRKANLVLFEPGYLENAHRRAPGTAYAFFKEAAEALERSMQLNVNFLRVGYTGQHITPETQPKDEQ